MIELLIFIGRVVIMNRSGLKQYVTIYNNSRTLVVEKREKGEKGEKREKWYNINICKIYVKRLFILYYTILGAR